MNLSSRVACIDARGDTVRVAVVKTGGKLPRILEVRQAKVAQGEEDRHDALVTAVAEAVSQLRSRPSVYVVCAPSEWSVVRVLKIPFRGRRRVAAAVRFELEPHLAFPIEDLVVDHVPLREEDGETEVLIVGMRRSNVEDLLAMCSEAGVAVDGVGLDAAGILALSTGNKAIANGLHATLHVENEGSILGVGRDKSPAYVRYVALRASRLHENPQAAARDVQNVLRAVAANWQGEGEWSSLTLSGETLFEEEFELFRDGFEVPVHCTSLVEGLRGSDLIDKLVLADDPNAGTTDRGAWSSCIGVAAAATNSRYSFNFLKDGVGAARSGRGVLGHAVFTGCLCILLLGAYFGYSYLGYRKNLEELDRVGATIWEEYAATFPDAEATGKGRFPGDIGGFKSIEAMQSAAEREGRLASALSMDLFSRPTLLDILKELSRTMPDSKVTITDLKISVGKVSEVTISGEVRDPTLFNDVLADLDRSAVFTLDRDRLRRSASGGRETFVIVATR